jgi:HAD superfamily hydrolase (TIGR01509 family)
VSEPRAILLDADGTLFPSEEPAFDASAIVTQRFADHYGLSGRFDAEHLRVTTTGQNFRTTARGLLTAAGITPDPAEFDQWVERERVAVSAHLADVLRPRPDVLEVLTGLAARHVLAAVSSSALGRLDACFRATGLELLIPADRRFSAEDSLPAPRSKPDPAVYTFALRQLGMTPEEALAVEDSPTGATSAVAAGITTVGLVQFVPPDERAARRADLELVGVRQVVGTWAELGALFADPHPVAG